MEWQIPSTSTRSAQHPPPPPFSFPFFSLPNANAASCQSPDLCCVDVPAPIRLHRNSLRSGFRASRPAEPWQLPSEFRLPPHTLTLKAQGCNAGPFSFTLVGRPPIQLTEREGTAGTEPARCASWPVRGCLRFYSEIKMKTLISRL